MAVTSKGQDGGAGGDSGAPLLNTAGAGDGASRISINGASSPALVSKAKISKDQP